jgi:glycosyltransferase involved in cell wall biosynthesis
MVDLVGDREIILNPYSNCDQGWLHQDPLKFDVGNLHPGMSIEEFSPDNLKKLREMNPSTDKTLIVAPFCAMYATLFSKKVFEKVGFLAEDFSNGGEDADYSYRAHAMEIDTFWTRSAFVFHFGGRTRKFAQDANPSSHQIEDQHNNSLLQKKWIRSQKRVKRVAIWTGPAWETWDLNTYKTTGIGGSETCAGRLAEIAVANGCQVTMYGQHAEAEQNGVMLRPYEKFAPDQEYYDLFVASRNLAPFNVGKVRAKKKLVWVHDIWLLSGQAISPEQLAQVDKFVCLSPWHENFFSQHHGVSTDKITIIPNGINTELFRKPDLDAKVPGKMHFSSSPDRGLDNLVYCLPFIRDNVPEIHLDVYYGFYNWKAAAQSRQNPEEMSRIMALERDIEKVKDCVHFMDRVNQPTLAERWHQAYLWAYPTLFTETYCITAKEAQLSGTPIICSNVGALTTTVGEYGKIIPEHPYTREGRVAMVEEIVKLHRDKDYYRKRSEQAYAGVARIDWQSCWEDYWSKWL